MDIHVANKINKSWDVVYIIKNVRQLFSKIVSSVGWRVVQAAKM